MPTRSPWDILTSWLRGNSSAPAPRETRQQTAPADVSVAALTQRLRRAAPGETVSVGSGLLVLSRPLVVPEGVRLELSSDTRLAAASALPTLIRCSGSVSGGILDGAGRMRTPLVRLGPRGSQLTGVTLTDQDHRALAGVAIAAQAQGVVVEGCTISGLASGVIVTEGAQNLTLRGNRITQWTTRGIWVSGTPTRGTVIEKNEISDLAPGGPVRYPLRVELGKSRGKHAHRDMTVRGNIVKGPDRSYNDPSFPGTADQISITGTHGLVLEENESIGGGDGAFTISVESRDVVIRKNRAVGSDVAGFFLGSPESLYTDNLEVTNNVVVDCGQNRMGNRRPRGLAGFRCVNTNSVRLSGNRVANEQGNTLHHAVSCQNVREVEFLDDNRVEGLVGETSFNERLTAVEARKRGRRG